MNQQKIKGEVPYRDLSPVRETAKRLSRLLPDEDMAFSDETWHLFHFATEDFAQAKRTINLAFSESDRAAPEIITMQEWLKKIDDFQKNDTAQRSGESKFRRAVCDMTSEQTYFVCFSNSERKNERAEIQKMQEFVFLCAEERDKQNSMQIASGTPYVPEMESDPVPPFYYRLFFFSYSTPCDLPNVLKTAQAEIVYPPLNAEDFHTLLWEYHLRKERAKQIKLIESDFPAEEIQPLKLSRADFEWYANRMSGLEEVVVRRLLASMNNMVETSFVDFADKEHRAAIDAAVIAYKNNILRQHDRLAVIPVPENDAVVGLNTLQKWVDDHAKSIGSYGDSPTGIVLVGIPGTGKSATAKSVANQLQLPLVQLDMSKVLGGRVGDSEKGMREMLNDLKFVAPCVLWIDEIEKALSGSNGRGGDGGTLQRLFGMLLTFIQENDRPVFTVTTANDISNLPEEFFRNGRFNQTFSLMMPNYKECCAILRYLLEKNYLEGNNYLEGKNYKEKFGCGQHFFDDMEICQMMNACLGTPENPRFLTGADITAHVKELIYIGFKVKNQENAAAEIAEKLKEVSGNIRAQASPAAAHTMADLASRYLNMMQLGLTMAGEKNTLYTQENQCKEQVLYYTFDENHPEMPLCMKETNTSKTFKSYRNIKTIPEEKKTEEGWLDPQNWYDAVFFYELNRAMTEKIFMEDKGCTPQAREGYWKYKMYELQHH